MLTHARPIDTHIWTMTHFVGPRIRLDTRWRQPWASKPRRKSTLLHSSKVNSPLPPKPTMEELNANLASALIEKWGTDSKEGPKRSSDRYTAALHEIVIYLKAHGLHADLANELFALRDALLIQLNQGMVAECLKVKAAKRHAPVHSREKWAAMAHIALVVDYLHHNKLSISEAISFIDRDLTKRNSSAFRRYKNRQRVSANGLTNLYPMTSKTNKHWSSSNPGVLS